MSTFDLTAGPAGPSGPPGSLSVGGVRGDNPSGPASTASASTVMMGLAEHITPSITGRVLLIVSGIGANDAAGKGLTVEARTGTGSAPANGDPGTAGTKRGVTRPITDSAPFVAHAILTGLALSTPIWLDLAVAVTGGSGNASVSDLEVTMLEF